MADSDLDYVHIVGRIGLVVGDGSDSGLNPDIVVPDAGGKVFFTPLSQFVKVAGSNPPVFLGNAVITCDIDSEGYLVYNGTRGVYLADLGSPKVNPSFPVDVADYKVQFNVKFNGVAVAFPSFNCHPLPGVDNDIAVMAPVTSGAGIPIVVGPAGPGIQNLQVESGRLVATFVDGTVQDAGALPQRAAVLEDPPGSGLYVPIGGDDSTFDESVADVLDRPDSAARATLTESIEGETPQTPLLNELKSMLLADLDDIYIANLGDSVSVDPVTGISGPSTLRNWFGQSIAAIGAMFPTYTIKWRGKVDGSSTWESWITVQTGTGPNTLWVSNWSQHGIDTGGAFASVADFAALFPDPLDFFFVSTAHNDDYTNPAVSADTFAREVRKGTRLVTSYYPACLVGLIILNPKTPGTARYSQKFLANQTLIRAAGEQGLGVVDLAPAFLDRVDGYNDLVPDGTHPNAGGVTLLRDTFVGRFENSERGLTSVRPRLSRDVVVYPIGSGLAVTGTPALAVGAAYNPPGFGVAFDPTTVEAWASSHVAVFPYWWQQITATVCVTGTVPGTGTVRLLMQMTGPGFNNDEPPLRNSFEATVSLDNASNWAKPRELDFITSTPPLPLVGTQKRNGRFPQAGESYPFKLIVTRLADQDTYSGDVLIDYFAFRQY